MTRPFIRRRHQSLKTALHDAYPYLEAASRELPSVDIACPGCGNFDSDRTIVRNGFHVVRCGLCGTLFVNPRPTEESLMEFYRRYPHLGIGPREGMADDPGDGQREAQYRLHRLLEFARSGHLLDLGCGRGDFLLAARPFFDVQGIDIAPQLPTSSCILVHEGRLEDMNFQAGSFDVVTAVEVLEHLFDPRRTLRCVHRILAPDGLLLVQTGDADSLRARLNPGTWMYLQPPVHLNIFTRGALVGLLRDTGFRIRRGWSFGRAPARLPWAALLPDPEVLRSILDVAGQLGLIGQMYAATKAAPE